MHGPHEYYHLTEVEQSCNLPLVEPLPIGLIIVNLATLKPEVKGI